MNIGFTGTRKGMSKEQIRQLEDVLVWLMDDSRSQDFHHGAAEGADSQAADISFKIGYFEIPHPAGNDPLGRNKKIVELSDVLIAAPATNIEELRSGTWATVRYARAAKLPVIMLSR